MTYMYHVIGTMGYKNKKVPKKSNVFCTKNKNTLHAFIQTLFNQNNLHSSSLGYKILFNIKVTSKPD